jgi:phenylalanyl-tRNA synthetase beta chain
MRTPLSWLREMTPIDPAVDPGDIAATLSDLGLVVEGIERVGEGLGQVVVALVREISPIEGADRIRRVLVDAGDRELEIVCGAWNFGVGDLVPLAPVGAILPGGFEIGRRKMRGVVSDGMLCSATELGLGSDASGLLVLGGEPSATGTSFLVPGTPITDALGIVPDVVFELEIAPNRPDALSVAGVARDLAARLRLPFALPSPRVDEVTGDLPSASVAVQSPELCTRLTGRVLTGVTVGASPPEVARRLLLCGMRPINSVVDASNYVMLELGQPTHPYDLDLLEGGLTARAARGGERLVTLDGVERELRERDCVITDGRDRPVGIGGIMGGANSEISAATTRVLLEAAHFDPLSIARTAKRLGLRTEASVRFERGCDPEVAELAGARYCELIASAAAQAEVPAPVVGELLDARPLRPSAVRVALRTSRVNAILGTELADDTIDDLLRPIGFGVERKGAELAEVTVPSFRPDTTREIDVIEEVARHYGYSAIPISPLRAPGVGMLTSHQRLRRRLRFLVTALGAHEAWTSTFVSPAEHERAGFEGAEVRVANPLVSEESVLRKGLLPGLLLAIRHNVVHRNPSLRLFEIGHVFEPPAPGEVLPVEREVVGVALAREGDGAESAVRCWRLLAHGLGILDVVLEQSGLEDVHSMHPTRAARLVRGSETIGLVCEVDPAVIEAFELPQARIGWIVADVERLLCLAGRSGAVLDPSRYPSSDIDLAFSVDEATPADAVEAALVLAAGELCESVHLFDVYRGPGVEPGRRSLAFRLRFCAPDRTLTDAEVSDIRARCVTAVEHSFPATLRG